MKNIFYKAVPGLFKRKQSIPTKNQPFFYNNKILESISKLEVSNNNLIKNVSGLNKSTVEIERTTKELFTLINDIHEQQELELENVLKNISENKEEQVVEIRQLKQFISDYQEEQKEKLSRQMKEIRQGLEKLKSTQETSQINWGNEYEALNLLLEGLYQRIDTLQNHHDEEMERFSLQLADTKREMNEANGIHIENNKTNADLLYKMREQHINSEMIQKEEQRNVQILLQELQQDIKKLYELMKKRDQLISY